MRTNCQVGEAGLPGYNHWSKIHLSGGAKCSRIIKFEVIRNLLLGSVINVFLYMPNGSPFGSNTMILERIITNGMLDQGRHTSRTQTSNFVAVCVMFID